MNIKPLSDRVVLKALESESVTKSGIYIPESANKERPFIYEVISVWPGKQGIEMNVQIWDKIVCWQYAWDDIKIKGEDYKIIAMEYILAKID